MPKRTSNIEALCFDLAGWIACSSIMTCIGVETPESSTPTTKRGKRKEVCYLANSSISLWTISVVVVALLILSAWSYLSNSLLRGEPKAGRQTRPRAMRANAPPTWAERAHTVPATCGQNLGDLFFTPTLSRDLALMGTDAQRGAHAQTRHQLAAKRGPAAPTACSGHPSLSRLFYSRIIPRRCMHEGNWQRKAIGREITGLTHLRVEIFKNGCFPRPVAARSIGGAKYLYRVLQSSRGAVVPNPSRELHAGHQQTG